MVLEREFRLELLPSNLIQLCVDNIKVLFPCNSSSICSRVFVKQVMVKENTMQYKIQSLLHVSIKKGKS